MASNTGGGVSVLLIDDHAIVRVGFRTLLAQQDWCGTISEAANGELGYQLFREHRPAVIVMDLSMPKMSGITTIQRINVVAPDTRILVVSVHDETVFVMQAIKAGAAGYVSKGSAPEEIVGAVRAGGARQDLYQQRHSTTDGHRHPAW